MHWGFGGEVVFHKTRVVCRIDRATSNAEVALDFLKGPLRFPRFQFAEIHDQEWCPSVLRDALTEWLRALWEYSGASSVLAPLVSEVIAESGATRIVDLCSGASGPLLSLQKQLSAEGLTIPAVMTDKFPARDAMARIAALGHAQVTSCPESVDATALPPGLKGFRTLFNSFHHFAPPQARAILEDACRSRQPIGVFEITERTVVKTILSFPASFLSCFLLIFRMWPRRPAWWVLTWILPLIPFMIGWDGLISHLRSYTSPELMQMAAECGGSQGYEWRTGKLRAPKAGVRISYLIGMPLSQ